MFRMNGRNRKKASKEKIIESKPKYQEDFNEIILNDLVPEEKKEEFGLNSVEQPKTKKSSGMKLNFGLGTKKSSSKGKNSSSPSKESKNTKSGKSEGKNEKNTQQPSKEIKNSKNKKGSSESSGNNNSNKGSNSKTNKEKTSGSTSKKASKKTKSSKSTKTSQSTIEEIQDIIIKPIVEEGTPNKKTIGPKKKRVKSSNKQMENENTREIYTDNEYIDNYESNTNFDSLNFRTSEEIDVVEKNQQVKTIDDVVEENTKTKFENLVWSEDKFPKQ